MLSVRAALGTGHGWSIAFISGLASLQVWSDSRRHRRHTWRDAARGAHAVTLALLPIFALSISLPTAMVLFRLVVFRILLRSHLLLPHGILSLVHLKSRGDMHDLCGQVGENGA